jgi:MFS family permease
MIARLRSTYAELPRVYWTVWLGTLVNKMGGVVVPFLALYLTRERGLSKAQAGLLVALYGCGTILAGLTGGVLADRVGRRATMLVSLFGGAVAMLGIGLGRALPSIAAATFLMGWLGEMYRPAVAALIADVVPPERRVRAYGHLYWAINLGFAVASALGGLAARVSYFSLFVVDAATMALYGVIVLLRVPETRPVVAEAQRGAAEPGILTVLADRTFMPFVALILGFAVVMWQNGTAVPMDMTQKGLSEVTYGALCSINGVLIVFLQPRMTAWLSPRPRAAVLAASSLVFGVGFGLFGFVSHWAGYAVAITIWTLGEIAQLPTANTVVADLAPTAMRGRYQGVYSMAWGAASVVAPIVGGAALDGPGGRALWVGCGALMALVGAGHLAVGKAIEARARAHRAAQAGGPPGGP